MDRHFPFTTWAYSHLFKVDGDSRTKSFALRLEYFFVGYIPSNVTFCVAMKKDALNNLSRWFDCCDWIGTISMGDICLLLSICWVLGRIVVSREHSPELDSSIQFLIGRGMMAHQAEGPMEVTVSLHVPRHRGRVEIPARDCKYFSDLYGMPHHVNILVTLGKRVTVIREGI